MPVDLGAACIQHDEADTLPTLLPRPVQNTVTIRSSAKPLWDCRCSLIVYVQRLCHHLTKCDQWTSPGTFE